MSLTACEKYLSVIVIDVCYHTCCFGGLQTTYSGGKLAEQRGGVKRVEYGPVVP